MLPALLRFFGRLVLGIGLAVGLGALPVWGAGQEDISFASVVAPADTAQQPPVVAAVRFAGNTAFSDDVLRRQVYTARNRRLLGVPGLTWWLGLYRLGDALGGRIGRAFKRGGEPPAYLDRSTLTQDEERLQQYYRRNGFREAQVDADVLSRAEDRVVVVFRISSGPALYARRVGYNGLEALSEEQRQQLVRESLFASAQPAVGDSLAFRANGQRYSETQLLEERQRILTFLRNTGYAAVTRDSIRALIFPQRARATPEVDSFDVTFRVRPGPRYRFGDVRFSVSGPEENVPARTDTLMRVRSPGNSSGGVVTAHIQQERRLKFGLLQRALRFQPGEWYDQSRLQETRRQLEGTGLFAFSDIQASPLGSAQVDTSGDAPRLPHHIELRTRDRHNIRLETFALQRSGIIASESELGVGAGAAYENINLLGGGEAFQVGTSGSIAANTDSGLFTSTQAEVNVSLLSPYLMWPFGPLEENFGLYDARTRLSLNLLTARRDALRLVIRGRGTARLRLEMQHSPVVTSLVDVFDVSLSNPDTLSGFRETFLDEILGPPDDPRITDPVQRAQIEEDYTRPQVNSALRYTFRAANVNPLRRRQGYSYEASFEVGNTLPSLLDAMVLTPDTLESSLPGLPFLRGERASRLIYRPYVRFVTDLRRYRPMGTGTVLAGKFIGGFAHPTGRPNIVPFDRRFYSGGATSVRGWELRALRPHPEMFAGGGDEPNVLGGDIKLEASAELRQRALRRVLGADWTMALFSDVGNVWFGPRNPGPSSGRFTFDSFYRELAVGSGLGLRATWEYLVLRLDAAVKVHDPMRPGSPLFPDGLGQPRLHFGIGHAF